MNWVRFVPRCLLPGLATDGLARCSIIDADQSNLLHPKFDRLVHMLINSKEFLDED